MLRSRGINAAVLESDVLRRVIEVEPRYDDSGRETFYRAMTWIGKLLTDHGVTVIFDATANRRRYRQQAREQIPRYLEVYVECPLPVCMGRDPKGIYQRGIEGGSDSVPGLGADYEPPLDPDVTVSGETDAPDISAQRILEVLLEKGYVEG